MCNFVDGKYNFFETQQKSIFRIISTITNTELCKLENKVYSNFMFTAAKTAREKFHETYECFKIYLQVSLATQLSLSTQVASNFAWLCLHF